MKFLILICSLFVLLPAENTTAQNILVDATAEQILEQVQNQQGKKPVMINFWATWCAPCLEEFPFMMDLHEKYGDEFELILVSGDFKEAREDAHNFLKEQGVDFTTYFKVGKDNQFIRKMSDNWTGALPFTVMYTVEGEVSASWEGKADYEQFESELMKVLKTENKDDI